MTYGPDGNVWFLETQQGQAGRLSPDGAIAMFGEFTTLTPPIGPPTIFVTNAATTAIASGPDGNLWITDQSADQIVRLTPSGSYAWFDVPTWPAYLHSIVAGSDDALWFTETMAGRIGRVTTDGQISETHLYGRPEAIVAGSDGNLWFSDREGSRIGRLSPSGTLTAFPFDWGGASGSSGAAGWDGKAWFTYGGSSPLIRVSVDGTIEGIGEGSTVWPIFLIAGPGNKMWFTEPTSQLCGWVAEDGTTATFAVPSGPDGSDYYPGVLAAMPDGTVWISSNGASGCSFVRVKG